MPELPPAAATTLVDGAAALGLTLTATQVAAFATYAHELHAWNQHTNLTSVDDPAQVVIRHFLDSLQCVRYWHAADGTPPKHLLDLGTGAGFPGVPLKLVQPALHLTLVDSVGKKTAFLRHLVDVLALPAVVVLTSRAEPLGHAPAHRATYDVVTARAVAALPVLAEYALPLLRVGGRLLAPKGATIDNELTAAAPALAMLGGSIQQVAPVQVPGDEPRTLVVIVKERATPKRYPRATGVPAHRPLA